MSEVRTFIAGTSKEKSISHESLARSALHLLQTLPVARHAVLEHLCSLFDEAVKLHILHSDDPTYGGENVKSYSNSSQSFSIKEYDSF